GSTAARSPPRAAVALGAAHRREDRCHPVVVATETVTTLLTVGHGTLAADELATLLRGQNIDVLVDVRSYPGSRRHPQFGRGAMDTWVPASGIEYRWEPRLGGRRRTHPGSRHVALINDAFRGYADHMETPEFNAALDDVLTAASDATVTVMCS